MGGVGRSATGYSHAHGARRYRHTNEYDTSAYLPGVIYLCGSTIKVGRVESEVTEDTKRFYRSIQRYRPADTRVGGFSGNFISRQPAGEIRSGA